MSLYGFVRGAVRCFFRIFFRVRTEGLENIPGDTHFVVCANHISALDPPMLGSCLPIKMRFMAKDELFKNKLFGKLLEALGTIPLKRNTGDIGALRTAVRLVENGNNLVVFPEGGRSTNESLGQGKSGAVLIALRARVNILPVGICGGYRIFSKITIKIGKPIELGDYFDKRLNSEGLQEITDTKIMPMISELSGVTAYENRDSR